jgi:hypothetical protein
MKTSLDRTADAPLPYTRTEARSAHVVRPSVRRSPALRHETIAGRRGCRTNRSANRCVNRSRDNDPRGEADGVLFWEWLPVPALNRPSPSHGCTRKLSSAICATASVPCRRLLRRGGHARNDARKEERVRSVAGAAPQCRVAPEVPVRLTSWAVSRGRSRQTYRRETGSSVRERRGARPHLASRRSPSHRRVAASACTAGMTSGNGLSCAFMANVIVTPSGRTRPTKER